MNRIEIAPSILNADLLQLKGQLGRLEKAGLSILHLDVMDGHFVPPLTFGPPLVSCLSRATSVLLEAHLMVDRPESLIRDFAEAGCKRVIVHVEATRHPHRLLGAIRELGVQAGVALNPGTPLGAIDPCLHLADLILIMTVNPGWGGQSFIPESLDRVRQLKGRLDERGLTPHIEVDGGVNEETIGDLVDAGANLFVAGTAVFGGDNPARRFRSLTRTARDRAIQRGKGAGSGRKKTE